MLYLTNLLVMLLHKEKTSFLGFSFMIDKDMLSYSIYLYIFKYNLPYLNTSHVNVNHLAPKIN